MKSDIRIVSAACRKNNNIILGVRHFDNIMRHLMMIFNGSSYWLDCEQGFIDNHGTFLTRSEAFIIANENNQIIRTLGSEHTGELYSENLY